MYPEGAHFSRTPSVHEKTMRHLASALLVLSGIISHPRETVRVRIENTAQCAVRVVALQNGIASHTFFVESQVTRTENMHVPSGLNTVTFRVSGIGCDFTPYELNQLSGYEPAIVLHISNVPRLSTAFPYRS